MVAYYNEVEPDNCDWLRELIARGVLPDGDVDGRSIRKVSPDDLRDYDQCHFFAGIGTWALALRDAGWADDRPVWTGSCPCQPFASPGKKKGFDDERHLWPTWNDLIDERRPPVIFGEQVASPDGLTWIDLVQSDLEDKDYAIGKFDLCAAGVGAPHIRQRLYFAADAFGELADTSGGNGSDGRLHSGQGGQVEATPYVEGASKGRFIGLRDAFGSRLEGHAGHVLDRPGRTQAHRPAPTTGSRDDCPGDPMSVHPLPGPVNGFWRDALWVPCEDEKHRPLKPGLAPLVDGPAAHLLRVRGYGNGIVKQLAEEFIKSYMELNRA